MKCKCVALAKSIENPAGISRKTLAYNDEAMLCHFTLKKGAQIPLHSHRATQIGYIISGKARFIAENKEEEFEATTGDAYVFNPQIKHGTIVLEDTVYIEVFTPARDEYKDY
jgi:quercetin dioxygenase-like cupin family protein